MPHTNEDTEKEIENEEAQTEDLQPNLQTGSITVQKDGHFIHCLTVIGQIEGHYILPSQNKTTKYEHVIPQLVAIEESDDVEGLLIILNTVGGDVEAGLAIANAHRLSGAGWRPLHRRAPGGVLSAQFYCAQRHHDGAPGAYERPGTGCAPDPVLF